MKVLTHMKGTVGLGWWTLNIRTFMSKFVWKLGGYTLCACFESEEKSVDALNILTLSQYYTKSWFIMFMVKLVRRWVKTLRIEVLHSTLRPSGPSRKTAFLSNPCNNIQGFLIDWRPIRIVKIVAQKRGTLLIFGQQKKKIEHDWRLSQTSHFCASLPGMSLSLWRNSRSTSWIKTVNRQRRQQVNLVRRAAPA